MKLYLLSLGAGLLVGVIYALLNVRSPAPPVVALIGLLGILLGEQAVMLAKHAVRGEGVDTSSVIEHLRAHSFAHMPKADDRRVASRDASAS